MEKLAQDSFASSAPAGNAGRTKALSATLLSTTAQQVRLAERREANVALILKRVGSVFNALGLEQLNLDKTQLTGAVLELLDRAKDPHILGAWEAAAAAHKAAHAAEPGFKCFIHTKNSEGELAELCRAEGMRFCKLPRGFTGRATLDRLVEIGADFSVTIGVLIGGTEREIVTFGVADAELLAKLRAEPDEPGSSSLAGPPVPTAPARAEPATAAQP